MVEGLRSTRSPARTLLQGPARRRCDQRMSWMIKTQDYSHRITSSAYSSIDSGMASPSALAEPGNYPRYATRAASAKAERRRIIESVHPQESHRSFHATERPSD